MKPRTKYTVAILAVVAIGVAHVVTVASGQSFRSFASDTLVWMLAKVQPNSAGELRVNTIVLDNNNNQVSQYLEPMLTMTYIGKDLAVYKRQDRIFAQGFEQ